jgi:hypothetical protein
MIIGVSPVVGELEALRGMDEHPDLLAGADPLGQERRGHALTHSAVLRVADDADGQVDLLGVRT